MRFIVYGAGAIGGVLGGRLFQAGEDVMLIARGPHHDAIRDVGLTIECPTGSVTLPVPVVDHPSRITFTGDDVVLLAVKGQHTADAIAALDAAAPDGVPVVSLQNGVENERRLLRTFADVYPVCVMMPAAHLEPGVVQASSTPVEGILDIGRHPEGVDDRAEAIVAAFRRAGFDSVARPDIARWKRRKLLLNLATAIDAVCGLEGAGSRLYELVVDEGVRCFDAAGLDVAPRTRTASDATASSTCSPSPGSPGRERRPGRASSAAPAASRPTSSTARSSWSAGSTASPPPPTASSSALPSSAPGSTADPDPWHRMKCSRCSAHRHRERPHPVRRGAGAAEGLAHAARRRGPQHRVLRNGLGRWGAPLAQVAQRVGLTDLSRITWLGR
jgi:2-dehydropantoate 2-reductase